MFYMPDSVSLLLIEPKPETSQGRQVPMQPNVAPGRFADLPNLMEIVSRLEIAITTSNLQKSRVEMVCDLNNQITKTGVCSGMKW